MTSLILENADLNRLFPKCRPKLSSGLIPELTSNHQQEQQYQKQQQQHQSHERNLTAAMIDLERDTSDRCRKRANGRKKPNSTSRRQTSFADVASTTDGPIKHGPSSSSSSASGRSEDAQHYGSLTGSDQQGHSQQDDSGPEESPVYILTSAKGDRSYKLRDSRIIEIAGGREVFSQSRGKVAARKPRFLTASNSVINDGNKSDNKLSLKKNNKSPNRQSIWELRSRCGETRKQRMHREITETVFSSEVHSVRRNTSKSILDYDSPKTNHGSHFTNYDMILNSNNVDHDVAGSKSIMDIEYGLPKNCIDPLGYQSSNYNTTHPNNMAIVRDGEVVVFDDIDDNWQNLRLEFNSTNTPTTHTIDEQLILQQHHHQQQHQNQGRTPPEPLSSSLCSSPSPTRTYHRTTSDFFKVITSVSDCETSFPSPDLNHKPTPRIIGELPIAQYSGSPKRYGMRDNVRLPTLLSSPSSIYVPARPGFPQRVLPVTPNQKEDENCGEINVESNAVIEPRAVDHLNDSLSEVNVTSPMSPSPLATASSLNFATTVSVSPVALMLTPPGRIVTSNLNSPMGLVVERERDEEEEEEAVEVEEEPVIERSIEGRLDSLGGSTFDYLYEFSETRKVLEEFFKCPTPAEEKENSDVFEFQDLDYELRRQGGSAYVGQRLASVPPSTEEVMVHESPKKHKIEISQSQHENNFLDLSVGTGSSEGLGETEVGLQVGHSRNFTLSPETTECDSNCGDLDSEISLMMMDNELLPGSGLLGSIGDLGNNSDSLRLYTSMPVLEDGLSSGHASDTDNNNPTVMLMKRQINEIEKEIIQRTRNDIIGNDNNDNAKDVNFRLQNVFEIQSYHVFIHNKFIMFFNLASPELFITKNDNTYDMTSELQLDGLDLLGTPPPPAPQSRQSVGLEQGGGEVEAAIKDIRMALQRTKTLPVKSPAEELPEPSVSPIWIPRRRICTESNSEDSELKRNIDDEELETEEAADEEADTDLETDRLLGQQRTDDQGFYDDKGWRKPKTRTVLPTSMSSDRGKLSTTKPTTPAKPTSLALSHELLAESLPSTSTSPPPPPSSLSTVNAVSTTTAAVMVGTDLDLGNPDHQFEHQIGRVDSPKPSSINAPTSPPTKNSPTSPHSLKEPVCKVKKVHLHRPTHTYTPALIMDKEGKKKNRNKEVLLDDPTVLIEGVLFRARYLGSTQLACEGQPTKSTRMCQAEEAVSRIKAPDGESQPSTEVDLFISTEKIMVLNTDLKEIMMDHALRTISYIADIGDLVVLMARRRFVPHEIDEAPKNRTPKMICHVFESEEAQFIAQSIGQAFQVAYMEFLKANGIEDHSFVKEMDYQEVLNSQEIFGDELQMFAKKEMQKEVVVPKSKGEILGVVIVESGWGSMLPTVVIANLAPAGAAARCGQLNIGDQIIAINGVSLVGLPLSTCQTYIKNSKNQTVVKLTVVPCAPVVEVKIKRPDTKYQLGFSVQNGVICSLLRGGIAERGGVRVGHRIIEINNQSVVAVPHEKIVNLLATSVGEILMKTMPTSMFRLLTGQESPVYI
ncbi:PREDICTED: uncharacterized protein LOC105366119 [Ceratosolen solmsi marchali]|uniref:Uncharacterized protein LOC105366119 n=1 Tax=Ceratosolen solmsi marchali TaxID=326594 RepID=A0AAJ6YR87_9HYME|nr:PREDICTED: uncharacterized protein LOC105366119 [Ceratosolen solmsi marchali]